MVNKPFEDNLFSLRKRVDHAFGWLMLGQWALSILVAFMLTPYLGVDGGRFWHLHA